MKQTVWWRYLRFCISCSLEFCRKLTALKCMHIANACCIQLMVVLIGCVRCKANIGTHYDYKQSNWHKLSSCGYSVWSGAFPGAQVILFGFLRGLSCKPNTYVSWSTSDIRVRLARRETGLNPPIKYFNWPFQSDASFPDHLSYFWLVFVMFSHARVCLLMPCGHLLGKGWPLGSRLSCQIVCMSLSHVISWVRCAT